jgi:hypothetical protein
MRFHAIMERAVERGLARRKAEQIPYLGVDEKAFRKGLKYLTLVNDLSGRGRTADGTVTRSGFERMLAEVCLGKVGAVAAREVSRFACNSREWQQLIEVCRVVDTVLIDQDTVYTPRLSNDRLLLGVPTENSIMLTCWPRDSHVIMLHTWFRERTATNLVEPYIVDSSASPLRWHFRYGQPGSRNPQAAS